MSLKPGTALRTALHPLMVAVWWLTRGRVDYRHCAACARRAAALDRILGNP